MIFVTGDTHADFSYRFNTENFPEQKEMTKGDSCEYHFTLGMWIRNNWIYEQDEEYVKLLAEMFGDDAPFFEPDDLSDRIIKSYQRHLRGLKKKMQG